jgi:hypothetical protein
MTLQKTAVYSPATRPAAGDSRIPWVLRLIVILGALLNAMGAAIALTNPAMLVSPQDPINGAVHIYAGYLAARNLALALVLVALLALGARRALGNLMAFAGLIQLLDAGMDLAEKRWAVMPGVLVLGVVFLVAAAYLSGNPFWRAEAWKQ